MSNLKKFAEFTIEDAEQAEEELAKFGSADFFKPQNGKNVIRFLPALAGEKWAVQVMQHFVDMPGGGKSVGFVCPRVHAKRHCPACEKADRLRASGNPNDAELAKKLAPKPRIFANIIDRKNPEKGVQVFPFPKQVFDQLLAIRKNEEAGGDFTNPGPKGFDIIVQKTGEKLSTEYKVLAAREETPLGNDEWLDQLNDLKRYAIPDTEEGLQRRLSGGRGGGGGGRNPELTAGGRTRNAADDTMDLD